MGTKNNPAPFDCYANAEDDEPMFVLLARDPHAPELVCQWAERRDHQGEIHEKVAEALACADAMEEWRAEHERCEGCRRVVGEGEYHTDSDGTVLCDAECWPALISEHAKPNV